MFSPTVRDHLFPRHLLVTDSFLKDLLYGCRSLRRSPGFAAAAILTLGLAIGASTAIFSVVRAVLLRPLPFRDPGRLVELTGGPGHVNFVVYRDLADIRDQCPSFESIGGASFSLLDLTGTGEAQALYGAALSADMMTTLGVKPLLGRAFLPSDDQPGRDQVVILSYQLWQAQFHGDSAIVGQHIQLSGPRIQDREIIGVMPPDFNFPLSVPSAVDPPSHQRAYWVPLGVDILAQSRNGAGCMAVARLKPGVSIAQAQAEVSTVMARLERDFPTTNTGRSLRVVSLFDYVLGSARIGLLAIWTATGLVLLIGAVNVANLLLARAANRSRETGIRLALGANRQRLFRQWLTESFLLALLGGGLGLMLAAAAQKLLLKLAPHGIPRLDNAHIDITVLAFSISLSVLSGVLFGALPAWRAASIEPLTALRDAGVSGNGTAAGRSRGFLIIAEVALCVPLAIGALLFVKSYARLINVDPGFRSDSVLTSIIILQQSRYPDLQSKSSFYDRLLDRLEEMPGVEAAGAVNGVPLAGNLSGWWMTVDGHPSTAIGEDRPSAEVFSVTPDYLRAIGVASIRGRGITRLDITSGSKVIIINELAGNQFWPNEDPLGQRINFTDIDKPGEWRTVIGVVKDTRDTSMDQPARPAVYVPVEQGLDTPQFLAVRTTVPPLDFEPELRKAVAALDPDQPVFVVTSMRNLVNNSVAPRRYSASMLSLFGILALVLAAIGVYGVVSYSTSRRTREIGLRVALGARNLDVLKLILGEGLVRAAIGIAIGLVAAFALSRAVSSLLYGVSATDPATFIGAPVLLFAITLAATYIPARGAMKVDPMVALREE
jgi:putative ABC transport system permease protein